MHALKLIEKKTKKYLGALLIKGKRLNLKASFLPSPQFPVKVAVACSIERMINAHIYSSCVFTNTVLLLQQLLTRT